VDAPALPDAPPDSPPGSCASAFSGILASYDFSAQSGSETSVTVSSTATGVTAGSFRRASSLTASSGSGSINSTNWATSSSRDTTKYYSVSITPPAGCAMSLTSLGVDAAKSSTGPASGAAATDADSFASTSTAATSTTSTPALSVTGATGAVEIRIYGYHASGTSGTFRVQNTFTISGSLN
jgi:hypothetical protein